VLVTLTLRTSSPTGPGSRPGPRARHCSSRTLGTKPRWRAEDNAPSEKTVVGSRVGCSTRSGTTGATKGVVSTGRTDAATLEESRHALIRGLWGLTRMTV